MTLDLLGRDTQPLAGFCFPAFVRACDQMVGDVIAVSLAVLGCVGRGHAVALTIEQQSGEQARILG